MTVIRRLAREAARLDLAVFRRVASYDSEALDRTLPRITRAADNSRLWIVVAGVLFMTRRRKLRRAGMRGLLAIAGTSAVVNGPFKWVSRRTRPTLDLVPEARRILKIPVTTSFPSGHTASAFAFATGASLEYRALAPVLYPLASAVGFSRVYTGAHFPADVLAGAAIGALAAKATGKMWPIPPEGPAATTPAELAPEELPTASGAGLAVVINEASGSGSPPTETIRSLLPEAEVIEIDPSNGEDVESALVRAADGAKALGVCGGDGTVNVAARIAFEKKIPLLVIPGGTLDHFAAALGFESVRQSVGALRSSSVGRVDIGWIDGYPFLNTASLGSYVELVETREKHEKRIGKWPALVLAVFQVLRRSEPVDVEIDGEPKRVWLAFFGNSHYRPAGFGPSWRERLDDGRIDLRFVEAGQPWARTRLIAAILTGRLGRCKVYQSRPVSSVKLASRNGALPLARDGETFDGSESFEVAKTEKGLLVFVPGEGHSDTLSA